MIVLDTNVLSETLRPRPEAKVLDWLNAQQAETLFITSVTVAEMMFGIAVLPEGRRKSMLILAVEELLTLFRGRILPFDTEAACHHAGLAVKARLIGRGFPPPDGYIAAIAAARGYAIASRDTAPYEAAGLKVMDPWLWSA
jgi:predicted nucleic acid-binding protein